MRLYISFSVTPDETLSSYGIVCGASVGTDYASIIAYRQTLLGGYFQGNGTGYTAYRMGGWDISYSSGTMQFTPQLYGTTTQNPDNYNTQMEYVGKNGYHILRKVSGISKTVGFTVTDIYGNTVTDAPTTDDIINVSGGTISNASINPGVVSGSNLESAIFNSSTNFWIIGIFEMD